MRDALFEAMHRPLLHRSRRWSRIGEENRDWGGAFAVYRGLTEALPYHRLFNSPITEGAIVGTAVGYALEGGRRAGGADVLRLHGPRRATRSSTSWPSGSRCRRALLKMPVVLRVSVGSKYGAQHTQDWTRMCAPHPGPEGRLPGDAVRRQGPDEFGARRHRSGDLLREPADLRSAGAVHPGAACRRAITRFRSASRTSRSTGSDLTILTIGADAVPRRSMRPRNWRRSTASRARSSTRARSCRSTTTR